MLTIPCRATTHFYRFNGATAFDGDLSNFDTSRVTEMIGMFYNAKAFSGQGVSNFELSSVTDMRYMFQDASLFNQNLCVWQDNFPYNPYTIAQGIFFNSGCTYQNTPQEAQKGPFCASDCSQ